MDCSFKSRSAQVLGIKGNIVAVLAERGCRIESVTIGDKIQTPRLEPKSTSLSRKEAEELLGIKLTDGEF
jgi:phenylalanyl-tRNA synthetase beta subunit